MVQLADFDPYLDYVIAALLLVLLYLLLKGKPRARHSRSHDVETVKREKDLQSVRENAHRRLQLLIERRGQLQRLASEAKKRYMEGLVTYEGMKHAIVKYEREIAEVDEQLAEYEGIYG